MTYNHHHTTPIFALLLCITVALSGCSQAEIDPTGLPEGKHPVVLATTVAEYTGSGSESTRATVDNTWDASTAVAVRINNEVKRFTATTGGTLTHAPATTNETPWYWHTIRESRNVTAWHPYSTTRPTTFSVQADQSTDANYQSSDMVYAHSQAISYGSNGITFRHLSAKVVVNLKGSDAVPADRVQSATVQILNQQLTSGAIDVVSGSVPQRWGGTATITPQKMTPATSGYHQTLRALLVPQRVQDTKFISVTVDLGDGTKAFYYTPATAALGSLEAGKEYTYNITVHRDRINVVVSDPAAAWGQEDPVSIDSDTKTYTPDELKPGDVILADGSIIDGGLLKRHSDGRIEREMHAEMQRKFSNMQLGSPPVGIVFQVDPRRIGHAEREYLESRGITPRGLAMRIANSADEQHAYWGGTYTPEIAQFRPRSRRELYEYNSGLHIQQRISPGTWGRPHILGIRDNREPAALNSTPWFVPSIGQWWDIIANLGGDTYMNSPQWKGSGDNWPTMPFSKEDKDVSHELMQWTTIGHVSNPRVDGYLPFAPYDAVSVATEYSDTEYRVLLFQPNGSVHLTNMGKLHYSPAPGYNLRVRHIFAFGTKP